MSIQIYLIFHIIIYEKIEYGDYGILFTHRMPMLALLSASGYPDYKKLLKTIDTERYRSRANTYHPHTPKLEFAREVSDHHAAKKIATDKATGRSKTSGDWATNHVSQEALISICQSVDNSNICNTCEKPDNYCDGDLVCCDGCLRSLHKQCAGLRTVPKGRWTCGSCHIPISQRQKLLSMERVTVDCQDY